MRLILPHFCDPPTKQHGLWALTCHWNVSLHLLLSWVSRPLTHLSLYFSLTCVFVYGPIHVPRVSWAAFLLSTASCSVNLKALSHTRKASSSLTSQPTTSRYSFIWLLLKHFQRMEIFKAVTQHIKTAITIELFLASNRYSTSVEFNIELESMSTLSFLLPLHALWNDSKYIYSCPNWENLEICGTPIQTPLSLLFFWDKHLQCLQLLFIYKHTPFLGFLIPLY